MKFKKVEISAFRIYDNPKDATFDFTTSQGDVANFVSIWAPNGFGKTSFYDAIEWGITNNVQRFYQNKNTEESIDAIHGLDSKQVSVFKNKNSSFPTSVKITFANSEEKIRDWKVPKNKKSDIYKDGEQIENREFRRVILSQEWISAFLKEVDGEKRYQKFMENPDLSEIDLYYRGVKNLVTYCHENIAKLQSKIVEEKEKIVQLEDQNLIETLNVTIKILNDLGENLKLLTNSTTDKEALDFQNEVGKKIIMLNRDAIIKEALSYISTARFGDTNTSGIDIYYESLSKKSDIEKQLKELETQLLKISQQQDLLNEVKNLTVRRDEALKSKKGIDDILEQSTEYFGLLKKLSEINLSKTDIDKKSLQSNSLLLTCQQDENECITLRDSLAIQISNLQKEINELPSLYLQKVKIEVEVKELSEKLTQLRDSMLLQEQEIGKLGAEVDELNRLITQIKNYPNQISESVIPEFGVTTFKNLQLKRNLSNKVLEEISILDKKVTDQENINSTIEQFVNMGLQIITENETGNCPLCDYKYESYKVLAEKITNNNTLSSAIQTLLRDRNNKSIELSTLLVEINLQRDILVKLVSDRVQDLSTKRSNGQSKYNQDLTNMSTSRAEYNLKLETSNFYTSSVKGMTYEDHDVDLKNRISKLQTQFTQESTKFAEKNSEKTNLTNEILNLQNQSLILSDEILKIKSNKTFIAISEWFENNYNGEEPSLLLISNSQKIHANAVNNAIAKLNESENNLKSLSEELTAVSKDDATIKFHDFNGQKHELDTLINGYQNLLLKHLNIKDFEISKDVLLGILDEKESQYKDEQDKITIITEKYIELEKYTSNLIPYLQTEQVKNRIKIYESEIEFLEFKTLPTLLEEKNSTRDFLNEKIQGYFYTELINEIYNKIDPHPDFKSVEFRPNFDYDSPKLDIFVVNNNEEEKLIPNLYFSTAQTNILSLSIFLATALTSKEYDSIFIDDPIQSLDSINVLSTIDLIRSIVTTQSKQVILSTHDQNFHNLLKKKIPSDLFSSKFIELESFGKVKHSTN